MTTYNTGNPLGSTDPRDLYDNAENLDNLVNGDQAAYNDRMGKSRKSWRGIEDEFSAFIAASGYEFVGDYAAGIELTGYQQVVRDINGEFWRLSGSVTLPYTTTGAGLPEGGSFVAVGDAALRQDLTSPDKGAAMVARGVVAVDSIADLLALPEEQRKEDLRYLVKGYYAGSTIGGGEFYWDASSVAEPNGGTVLGSGVGRFRRLSRSSHYKTEDWGVDASGSTDAVQRLQACLDEMEANGGGLLSFLPGTYLFESGAIRLPSNIRIEGNGSTILVSASNPTNVDLMFAIDRSKISIRGFKVETEQRAGRMFLFTRCSGINLSYILNETDRTIGGEQSIITRLAHFYDVTGVNIRHINSTYSVAGMQRCRDVLVENIRCVQPEKITEKVEVFDCPGLENAVFRNIYAEGVSEEVLDLSALRNVTIENLISKDCGVGITAKTELVGETWPYINQNNIVIRNVHVEGWDHYNGGIHINATAVPGSQWAKNVLIENCTLIDTTGSAPIGMRVAIGEGAEENRSSVIIRNCMFGTDQHSAGDKQLILNGSNITVDGCSFYGGMGGKHAIEHSVGRNLTISNCKFYSFSPGDNGVLWLYTTRPSDVGEGDYDQKIKLIGCRFIDCVAPDGRTVRIGSGRASGHYVAGNTFTAPEGAEHGADLYFTNQDNWIVEGNRFSGVGNAVVYPGSRNFRMLGNINQPDMIRADGTNYYPTWSTTNNEPTIPVGVPT